MSYILRKRSTIYKIHSEIREPWDSQDINTILPLGKDEELSWDDKNRIM